MVSNDFTLSQDNKDRDEIPLSYRPIYIHFLPNIILPFLSDPQVFEIPCLQLRFRTHLLDILRDNFQYHCSIHTRYQMDESFIQFLTFKQEIFQISSNPVV